MTENSVYIIWGSVRCNTCPIMPPFLLILSHIPTPYNLERNTKKTEKIRKPFRKFDLSLSFGSNTVVKTS